MRPREHKDPAAQASRAPAQPVRLTQPRCRPLGAICGQRAGGPGQHFKPSDGQAEESSPSVPYGSGSDMQVGMELGEGEGRVLVQSSSIPIIT
uniref:Uncharacterized protein n=1 Tax=Rangifer tarandus platyrhynchus TaxID=3082113 RepID=A0ACB0E591_RANTA|nr:unnamed protein product [Rangifer tarandus platyrhynchus]